MKRLNLAINYNGIFLVFPVVHCPTFSAVPNSNLSSFATTVYSEVNITCVGGYAMPQGEKTMVVECGPQGQWTPEVNFCIGTRLAQVYECIISLAVCGSSQSVV